MACLPKISVIEKHAFLSRIRGFGDVSIDALVLYLLTNCLSIPEFARLQSHSHIQKICYKMHICHECAHSLLILQIAIGGVRF